MADIRDYKLKRRKGLDDLMNIYAFVGNSQGDESRTNDIATFIAAKGWMSYVFDVPMTPENIAKEVARRRAWNLNYINNLHTQGKYGEEYEVTVSIEYNPALDDPHIGTPQIDSYRMVFLDFREDAK